MKLYRSLKSYSKVIHDMYGRSYRNSSHNEIRTRKVEVKILELGIDFNTYMEISVSLYADFARSKGWKYPYWNVVTGDKAIARVRELLRYADMIDDDDDCGITELYLEIAFIMDYVSWYLGWDNGNRPVRYCNVSTSAKTVAAQYICDVHGVNCVSSNLNYIAERIYDSKSGGY